MSSYIESFFKRSLAMFVDSSLNVCKEFAKFIIILFILYHFTIWSFQIWDEILEAENVSKTMTTANTPDILAEFHADVKETAEIIKKEMISTEFLANANSEIEKTPLIDQLEIEAEFEVNQDKLNKSELKDESNITPKIEEPAGSSNPSEETRTRQQSISFDDEYDHESFHRA